MHTTRGRVGAFLTVASIATTRAASRVARSWAQRSVFVASPTFRMSLQTSASECGVSESTRGWRGSRASALAKSSGEPVALSAFQFSPEETSRIFTDLDEDYHISRFLHFSNGAGQSYSIGGEAATHVAIDSAISSLL